MKIPRKKERPEQPVIKLRIKNYQPDMNSIKEIK